MLVTVKSAPDIGDLPRHVDAFCSTSDESVALIGVLRVELTRGSRLLTVPKLIEIAAQQIAMEMLRGFGSVRSQPITWWEDSVYGYVIKRFGLEKSSAFSMFAQEAVSLKESSLTDQEKVGATRTACKRLRGADATTLP